MKNIFFQFRVVSLFVFSISCGITNMHAAEDCPIREVPDALDIKGKLNFHYMVSPMECKRESKSKIPESEITFVSAHNSTKFLRFEVALSAPVSMKQKVCYGFKLGLAQDTEDMFVYFPLTKKFFFASFKNDEMTNIKEIELNTKTDHVILGTRYHEDGTVVENQLIIFFFDKDKHFSLNDKGQKKQVTAKFFSGSYKEGMGDIKDGDSTPTVKIKYTR